MENASKALLIAGGILLTMLVIGLLIFAWSRFTEFYDKQDELAEIEDISKFNLQFTNYVDRKVYGYEIISLANKIADYNFKHSNDPEAKNDEKYNPITITVTIGDELEKFGYSDSGNLLIDSKQYTQNSVTNTFSNIMKAIEDEENVYGRENLQRLSKSINSIFLDEKDWSQSLSTEEYKKTKKEEAIKKFNSITKSSNAKDDRIKQIIENIHNYDKTSSTSIDTQYNAIQNNFKQVSYKYYEYTQFKKGIFDCNDSDIDYDDISGRVSIIGFTFTGDIE